MSRMTLRFVTENKAISLIQTYFEHPLLATPHVAQRGQQALPCSGTFRWSTGVMGLSILLVKHAVRLRMKAAAEGQQQVASIDGGRGSLACSLDYALSKQPLWLKDMFGISAKGSCLSHLLLRRINPERKRPGPVVVFIPNISFIVDVYVDGRNVLAPKELGTILRVLEKACNDIPQGMNV
jgi:hypothetical protein